jgi:hypothetical protein
MSRNFFYCIFFLCLGIIIASTFFGISHVKTEKIINIQTLVFDVITICLGIYIATIIDRNNRINTNIASISINRSKRYISNLESMQVQLFTHSLEYDYVVSVIKLLRSKLTKAVKNLDCGNKSAELSSLGNSINCNLKLLNTMLTDTQYGFTIGKPSSIQILNNTISIDVSAVHYICNQIDCCIDLIYDLQVALNKFNN